VFLEIKHLNQERGTGRRRWFESDGLDFVVWYGSSGQVTGFQLCYDFGQGEHALTWREGTGFVHSRIDAGDQSPLKNRSPTLELTSAVPPWSRLAEKFDVQSDSLEPELRRLVGRKLAAQAGAEPSA